MEHTTEQRRLGRNSFASFAVGQFACYSCSGFLYGGVDPRQALEFLSMVLPEEAEH